MSDRRRAWSAALAAHALAALAIAWSLRVFLTPLTDPSVPPQPLRYALYGLSAFLSAVAAGSMLSVLLTGGSWLPAVYLWLLPLVIVALPWIDPSVAGFVYVGFTGHIGAGLAVSAALLWIVGCVLGVRLGYRFGPTA